MWKEAVFKVVFSCAVGLELQFVGGPSYFLLMSDVQCTDQDQWPQHCWLFYKTS